MRVEVVYKNSAQLITVDQALEANRYGIFLAVNDGKHITVSIEKEPTSPPAN